MDDDRDVSEVVEPPPEKVDSHFEDLPKEDYADIHEDVGEGSKVGKKKAERDG